MMLFWLLVVVILGINITLFRKQLNIGLILVLNTSWIIALKGLSISQVISYFTQGVFGHKTVNLISIFILILIIESIMRKEGLLDHIINGLDGLFGHSMFAPSMMPLIIGMLPSPGGARLSCPMVEATTKDSDLSGHKAYVNYWYRHNWLDGFILYPPIILAAEILELNVLDLFIVLLPVMAAWFFVGIIMGLRHFKKKGKASIKFSISIIGFLRGIYPFIIILSIYLMLLRTSIAYPLQISLIITIIIMKTVGRIPLKEFRGHLKNCLKIKFIVIFVGAMTFTTFFQQSGLIDDTITWMNQAGMSTYMILCLLPFIVGLMSGASITYISITFPLLIGLGISDQMPLFILAYSFGMMGVILSPLHLCHIISADYFKVPMQEVTKRVAMSCILLTPMILLIVMVMG